MSFQTYVSTPQTTNAARLFRVLGGPCTDLLRDVLRWRIPETAFPNKLLIYEHSIKPRLSRPQRDMLYPQFGPCIARYTDFDISLLYVLLRNACSITPHSKGWGHSPSTSDYSVSAHIDRLREIRNEYCGHSPITSVSDLEFALVWDEIRQIVQDLEFHALGPSVAYVNAVDALKTVTMDPDQEQSYIEEIEKQKRQDMETRAIVEKVISEQSRQNLLQKEQEVIQKQGSKVLEEHGKVLARHTEILSEQCNVQTQQRELLSQQAEQQTQHSQLLSQQAEKRTQHSKLLSQQAEKQAQQSELLSQQAEIQKQHSKLLSQQAKKQTQHSELLSHQAEIQKHYSELLSQQGEIQTHQNEILLQQSESLSQLDQMQMKQRDRINELDIRVKQVCVDLEAANIIANTDKVLKSHVSSMIYTETSVVNSAMERLNIHSVVILTGKGGEGKTTAGLQIMFLLSTDYTPAIIEEPYQWDKIVNADKNMVVFLDDVLGRTNLNSGKMENWRNKFRDILSSTQKGKVRVLIALREGIFKDVQEIYSDQELFNELYEINLSSNDHGMTEEDKRKMLDRYHCIYRYKASELQGEIFQRYALRKGAESEYKLNCHEKRKIIESNPYFGFPQTCFLFFTRKKFFELGSGFFKHPHTSLLKDIDKMRKSSKHLDNVGYCVLVYVFMFRHIDITTSYIDCTAFTDIGKTVRLQNFTDQDIKDAIEELQGPYLSIKNNGTIYKFSHTTVREAVLLSFGQLSPETVLQHCSKSMLNELIRTENYKEREGEIVLKIPKRHYPTLVEKLVEKLICCYGDYFCDFLNHPATDDADFAAAVFSSYQKQDRLNVFKEIVTRIPRFNKPEMINALLKYIGPDVVTDRIVNDCNNVVTIKDNNINEDRGDAKTEITYFCESNTVSVCTCNCKHLCDHFVLSKHDIFRLLDDSVLCSNGKGNVLVLCKFINGLSNASEYYVRTVTEYGRDTGRTLLDYCVAEGWDDAVKIILNAHTPTDIDIFRIVNIGVRCKKRKTVLAICQYINEHDIHSWYYKCTVNVNRTEDGYTLLDHCASYGWDDVVSTILKVVDIFDHMQLSFKREQRKTMLAICQYVNGHSYADKYYDLDYRMLSTETNFTVLHHCVTYGWDDIVDVILNVHTPTQTDKNWSCAHLAAFFGRCSLLKKFVNMGQAVNDTTSEGYSVLHTLLLGLRYNSFLGDCFLDVNRSYATYCMRSSDDDEYNKIIQYLLSSYPTIMTDLHFPLDEYMNNIVHYLVIHNRESLVDLLLQRHADIFYYRNSTVLPTALHIAVYLGRQNLAKKFWEVGIHPERQDENLTDNSYSLLHSVLLGLRYGYSQEKRYIDVEEISGFYPNEIGPAFEEQYLETIHFILSVYPTCITDFSLPLDRHNNNIIHYLVIHRREKILGMLSKQFPEIFYHHNNTVLPTALHVAAFLGRFYILCTMWIAGVRIESLGENQIGISYSLLHSVMLGLRYSCLQKRLYMDVEENAVMYPDHIPSSTESDYSETIDFVLSEHSTCITDLLLPLDRYENNIIHYLVMHNREMLLDKFLKIFPEVFYRRNNTVLPTALHIAGYLGRCYFLSKRYWKYWNAGIRPECLGEDWNDSSYSLLHAVMLGLRYRYQQTERYIDVEENTKFYQDGVWSSLQEDYCKTIRIILLVYPTCITELSSPLDKYGNTLIHYLIIHEYEGILDLLLFKSPDIAYHRTNSKLPTVLHVAVYLGRYNIVKMLWTLGIRPKRGDISLMDTMRDGRQHCAKTLFYNKSNEWVDKWGLHCVLGIKFFIIRNVEVTWGDNNNFDEIERFVMDNLTRFEEDVDNSSIFEENLDAVNGSIEDNVSQRQFCVLI